MVKNKIDLAREHDLRGRPQPHWAYVSGSGTTRWTWRRGTPA
jgi:hypothetical protein